MDAAESKSETHSSGLPSASRFAPLQPQGQATNRSKPFSIDYILNSNQVAAAKRQRTINERNNSNSQEEALVNQLNLMNQQRAEQLMLAAAAAAAAAETNEMQSAAVRGIAYQHQAQMMPLGSLLPTLPQQMQAQMQLQQLQAPLLPQNQLDKFAQQAQGQPNFLYLMTCMLLQQQQQQRQTAAASNQHWQQQQQQMAAAHLLGAPVRPNTMESLALLARLTGGAQGALSGGVEPLAAPTVAPHQVSRDQTSNQRQHFFAPPASLDVPQHQTQTTKSFVNSVPSVQPPPPTRLAGCTQKADGQVGAPANQARKSVPPPLTQHQQGENPAAEQEHSTALSSLSNFVTNSLAPILNGDSVRRKQRSPNTKSATAATSSTTSSPSSSSQSQQQQRQDFYSPTTPTTRTRTASPPAAAAAKQRPSSPPNVLSAVASALKNCPPSGTTKISSTLAKAPLELVQKQPAWVFCTRYSDRPSSGPRTRRMKSKEDKRASGKDSKLSADEKRPRTAFTSEQLEKLRQEFQENSYLDEKRRKDLAERLCLNENQIKIWFQNKRAKMKKQSNQPNPLRGLLVAGGLYNHSTGNSDCSESYANGPETLAERRKPPPAGNGAAPSLEQQADDDEADCWAAEDSLGGGGGNGQRRRRQSSLSGSDSDEAAANDAADDRRRRRKLRLRQDCNGEELSRRGCNSSDGDDDADCENGADSPGGPPPIKRQRTISATAAPSDDLDEDDERVISVS